MRVMVIVKATTDSEAGKLPSAQLMADMGAFNQQLIAAGIMTDGAGLKPTSQGARVAFSGAIARCRKVRSAMSRTSSPATGSGR